MSAPKWSDYVEEDEAGVRMLLEEWDAKGLQVYRLRIDPVSRKNTFRIYSGDIVGPKGKKGLLLVDKAGVSAGAPPAPPPPPPQGVDILKVESQDDE